MPNKEWESRFDERFAGIVWEQIPCIPPIQRVLKSFISYLLAEAKAEGRQEGKQVNSIVNRNLDFPRNSGN